MTRSLSSPAFLWLNGFVTAFNEAVLSPSDRGFLLGDGLYETFRFSAGKAPHLARHWERLKYGCDIMRLETPPYSLIEKALAQLSVVNQLESGSARLTVTRGPGPRGLVPPTCPHQTIMLTINPLPEVETPPIHLYLSSYQRDSKSVLCRIKSINALSSILARIEAREQQADDALLLNEKGFIAEATASNFLALCSGTLVTPFIKDGALPGISRQRLIDAGHCFERSLLPDDLPSLEGAWLVTSLTLTPIYQINHIKIPVAPDMTQTLRHFLYESFFIDTLCERTTFPS